MAHDAHKIISRVHHASCFGRRGDASLPFMGRDRTRSVQGGEVWRTQRECGVSSHFPTLTPPASVPRQKGREERLRRTHRGRRRPLGFGGVCFAEGLVGRGCALDRSGAAFLDAGVGGRAQRGAEHRISRRRGGPASRGILGDRRADLPTRPSPVARTAALTSHRAETASPRCPSTAQSPRRHPVAPTPRSAA